MFFMGDPGNKVASDSHEVVDFNWHVDTVEKVKESSTTHFFQVKKDHPITDTRRSCWLIAFGLELVHKSIQTKEINFG